jgi:hypothetical protein
VGSAPGLRRDFVSQKGRRIFEMKRKMDLDRWRRGKKAEMELKKCRSAIKLIYEAISQWIRRPPQLLDQCCQMVYFFVPKLPIWVYFRGPWNVKCWYILVIWYILRSLSKFW